MRFFCVYDLIMRKANLLDQSPSEMFATFKHMGVKKADLLAFRTSSVIPNEPTLLNSILSYLEITELELHLSLGRIPEGFEDSYFERVQEIAKLLSPNKEKNAAKKPKPIFETNRGILFNNDCMDVLSSFDSNSVDMVFADPPFNLDKEYDKEVDDNQSVSRYLSWCMEWLNECIRILKPGGSLFIYNLPKWHTYLADYLNTKLTFWNWIGVDMKFSLPIPGRLYPAHYSLLYYVKGEKPKTFHPQRIPIQTCRHCGGEMKDYGGYKNKMNPGGVNVSDIWSDIYPVRHKNSKNRKFNELPVKLLDRVITMSTNEDDVVLDPFGGSGTTFAVSELLHRRWFGVEVGNCDGIIERLKNQENDRRLLNRVYDEKNKMFSDKVKNLRRLNGFWLPEDFTKNKNTNQ